MKMKTFKEFLMEDLHAAGTYVNVKVSAEDQDKLYSWCEEHGIGPLMDKEDYHATVVYSPTPCPDAKHYDFNLPATANIVGWKAFDSQLGRCLVAQLQSEDLDKFNADMKNIYGATSNFPSYIPHITVSWGYEGALPENYPAFKITFDKAEVKGIDPNWKPKK
jgi:hypothetical protein